MLKVCMLHVHAKGFNALINIKYIYQCIKYMYKKCIKNIFIYIFLNDEMYEWDQFKLYILHEMNNKRQNQEIW